MNPRHQKDATATRYNALGQRVRDQGDGVYNPVTVDEAYNADGTLIWRYTGYATDPNQRAFVYLGNRLLAEYYGGSPSGTLFYHPDQIGSGVTATDYTGNAVYEKLYYPFGQFWNGADPNQLMHHAFAQLPDWDAESNQYNTLNRHYAPTGRWMSPDPGGAGADPNYPQSWNLYAYVGNNPTTLTDPLGLFENCPNGIISNNVCIQLDDTPPHGHVNEGDGLPWSPVILHAEGLYHPPSPSDSPASCGGKMPANNWTPQKPNPCPPGTTPTTQNMLVTGYDNSFQSTGKNPGDAGYGLTASNSVAAYGTIAAPRTYSFGTQMYIPGYGLGTVLDRGGAIKNSHIDLWFPTTQQATKWGAQHLQVTVCHE